LPHFFFKIRGKISDNLERNISNPDILAICKALFIGDRTEISEHLQTSIQKSGLSHLLAISGLHLSLVATIFFIVFRFCLLKSQYLALNFDLKKISAFFAIIASFCYLEIANAPISAQRAFLMILLAILALFLNEKANFKRIILFCALILVVSNPYILFKLSLQLSLIAIITIFLLKRHIDEKNRDIPRSILADFLWMKILKYFFLIIVVSILIQITTAPILIKNFGHLAILSFVANILAIPLTTFLIIPLGLLAILLSLIFSINWCFILLEYLVKLLIKVSIWVADFRMSEINLPLEFNNLGVFLAIFGVVIFFIFKTKLRFVGLFLFILSFLIAYYLQISQRIPDIIIDEEGKFFALYDKESGLIFSKKIRSKKTRDSWMKKFREDEFKYINKDLYLNNKTANCNKRRCIITFKKGKKVMILLQRAKISDIDKSDYDEIINLNKKYILPDYFLKTKNFTPKKL